ncbi:MAG: metal-dependent hydrolase [Bacteroidia bacterium]
MDIISHSLTGIAVGTVVAAFSRHTTPNKALIVLAGGFGGALPDFDAISLWSNFDATIGSVLNVQATGKEIYFGKFWYSHHAAMHSLIAPLFFILLASMVRFLFKRNYSATVAVKTLKRNKFLKIAFFLGFLFHLFEDMPTPSSVWGGVNFFFPSTGYIGGFGKIWWWNNYDLVLIILFVIAVNLLINVILRRYYLPKIIFCISVFALGLFLFLYQINTRPFDFGYEGHAVNYEFYEAQSKVIQKEILGEKVYNMMWYLDNKIPLNF